MSSFLEFPRGHEAIVPNGFQCMIYLLLLLWLISSYVDNWEFSSCGYSVESFIVNAKSVNRAPLAVVAIQFQK